MAVLIANVLAIRAAQQRHDLSHRRRIEPQYTIEEDRPVEIGVREAIRLGLQFLMNLAVGNPERIEIRREMPHAAIRPD